jgi:phosphatidylglycerophosphatase A
MIRGATPRGRFGGVGPGLATAFASGLGSGYWPFAPGTAGSLVGLALFPLLARLPLFGQLAVVAGVSLLGVLAAGRVAARVGRKDPGVVVIDEIVGQWVALILIPLCLWTAIGAFLLFRLTDIVKPYPARQLEALPGGWGIVADDLMAGLYANLLLRVALLVWPAS